MERSKKPSAIPVSPGLPAPQISIDNSRVTANLPTGERVVVLLYGATVISWTSSNGKENLFLSSKAHLDGSKPVRGGIPLVFPVFGPPNKEHATGKLPQHGFARTSRWEYLGKTTSESSTLPNSSGDSSIKLDFGLSDTMIGDASWPYQFAITYSVTLSPTNLETTLVVRNTGTSGYDFQTLFHTYLKVDDVSQISITGLEKAGFKDKVQGGADIEAASEPIGISSEVDRVYTVPAEQAITVSSNGEGRFKIARDMLSDVVVWNPWVEKSKGMADFGPDDGYKSMVCVEAGSVSAWNNLEAGDAWEGGQRITALS